MGYGAQQMTNIFGWAGEVGRPELKQLGDRIEATLTDRRAGLYRPQSCTFGKASPLPLPTFFFSVSSHETQVTPFAAVRALNVFGAASILVSAYDMVGKRKDKKLLQLLARRMKKGATVLLDSGNYEKTRREDSKWTRKKFHRALLNTPHTLAFCYDKPDPDPDLDKMVRGVVRSVMQDAKVTKMPVLPIVHLPQQDNGDFRTEFASEAVFRVAKELRPPLIGIPERELGPGIIARTATMLKIREALRKLYFYQPVHILGTGNPISIALLTAAGADSFDGLEWTRFAVDADSARLYHFQHFELFQYQAKVAASPITARAASDEKVHYAARALFHNLDFYTTWLAKLRSAALEEKRLVEFLTETLPKGAMLQARTALPGVL
jgi:hypothetical protein